MTTEKFTEKFFRTYNSKLGDYLFPEQSFFEIEANHIVSELMVRHKGNIESPQEFLLLLDKFIPEVIQDSIDNPSWSTDKTVSRWENMTKEMIRQRVREKFSSELSGDASGGKTC